MYAAAAGCASMMAVTRATTAATCAGAAPVNRSGSASRPSSAPPGARPSRSSPGQPGDQVVVGLALLPHRERDGDGVLLDHLVGGLPADAGPHRGHQHGRRGEERQVAVQLAGDHRRVGAELVEHGQRGLVQPVEREERVGQRDAAHDRVGHVALVPLRPGQLAGHAGVAAQQHQQPVDPLGRAGVHLVRHRRRPDLAGRNPSVASSAPAISRIVSASDDGAAPSWTSALSTSKSSDRG